MEDVLAPIRVPFPELTYLRLFKFLCAPATVIPDSFLGGSAPRLRHFELSGIPFPGFPNLLLSANRLVSLRLFSIPDSGYVSPEAMVALLRALSNLEALFLGFQYPQSHPDRKRKRQSLPPPKRSILPALGEFHFKGVVEYLEEFLTSIETPQLDEMHIDFFFQMDIDFLRLAQFFNRTPTLGARNQAHVQLDEMGISVTLLARGGFEH